MTTDTQTLPYIVRSRCGSMPVVIAGFAGAYEAVQYAISRRMNDQDRHVNVEDRDGTRIWPSPSRGICL